MSSAGLKEECIVLAIVENSKFEYDRSKSLIVFFYFFSNVSTKAFMRSRAFSICRAYAPNY